MNNEVYSIAYIGRHIFYFFLGIGKSQIKEHCTHEMKLTKKTDKIEMSKQQQPTMSIMGK
jgi:hypothetical protein